MKTSVISGSNGALSPSGWMGSVFLRRLLGARRGRVFMLSFMAYAEEADEQGLFDTLLARVDDAELGKLVRLHRDDEARHAALLRECLTRLGAEAAPVPAELRLITRIERHVDGLGQRFVQGTASVMEAYLLLQVIEERGVRQFPVIADAMRPHDPVSADVIDRITRDEQRHVKYAKAISRRYAPSPAALEQTLSALRRAEEAAFFEHSTELLRYATAHNLQDAGRAERLLWHAVAASGSALQGSRSAPVLAATS
jgi:rubrerythrin